MRDKKFLFASNRFYVLEQRGIDFTVIKSKDHLISTLESIDFD
jgi:hypothetical protein